MIEKPKSAHNTPFQYIVLLIDNLDQSPINVVEHAITTIINGWHERGSRIKLWQIFLPLRPSTLHTLRMRRVVFPSNVVVPLGRVDYVKLLEARTKWVRNAIRETGDSIAYEDSNHNRYVKDNSGCVRYFDDVLSTVKNYNPEFMNFVPKIVDGDLNRALGIWYGLCASEVMFWTHEQIYPISLYELRCAMLSGKYRVQDRDMPCVGNLFFMTDRFVSAHDLLIGPHMLFLLQEDDLYENLHVALEDLGYQKNRIKSVAKKFQELRFFHLRRENGNVKIIPHDSVIQAYRDLYDKPAYLDEIAMTTPAEPELLYQMHRTTAYDRNQLVNRVLTTLNFIKQVRYYEETFCLLSKLPKRITQTQFKKRLESLRIPRIWKQMAISYKTRLMALEKSGDLETDNRNEQRWRDILSYPLFSQAKLAEDSLLPKDSIDRTGGFD